MKQYSGSQALIMHSPQLLHMHSIIDDFRPIERRTVNKAQVEGSYTCVVTADYETSGRERINPRNGSVYKPIGPDKWVEQPQQRFDF